MPKTIERKVSVLILTDARSTDGLEMFGIPIVKYTGSKFESDIRNFVAILDTDGTVITTYKIGSSNGFDPAYNMVDSILFDREASTLPHFYDLGHDSVDIAIHATLTPQNPLISRFIYNSSSGEIELFSTSQSTSPGLVTSQGGPAPPTLIRMDTAGNIIHSGSCTAGMPSVDSIDQLLYAKFDEKWRIASSFVRFFSGTDTMTYGKRARMFTRFKQVIGSPIRNAPQTSLILPTLVGNFITANENARIMWIFDNKTALTGRSDTAEVLIVNDSSFASKHIRVPMGFEKPEMYFTAAREEQCFILPNAGRLVRVDTAGNVSYQQITCTLTGLRICTFTSGSYIGAIQEVGGKRLVVFFNTDGQRVSDPVELPSKTSYAALLDSGYLIVLSSLPRSLRLYRSKAL